MMIEISAGQNLMMTLLGMGFDIIWLNPWFIGG